MRKWGFIAAAVIIPFLWVFFEWSVLSFASFPIAWGWWGVLILIVLSWFLPATHIWIAGISLAVGYEALSIHPFGVVFLALAGMLAWTTFLEKRIFVRYSFVTLLISVAVGTSIFALNYIIVLFFLGMFFPSHVSSISVLQLGVRAGIMLGVYMLVAFIFYISRAIVLASFTRYFVSRRFD